MEIMSKRSFIIPFVLYFIFMLLTAMHPRIPFWVQVVFILYSVFLFWLIWGSALDYQAQSQEARLPLRFFKYILLSAGVIFIFTRAILFLRYGEAPLGYDTGFYLKTMEDGIAALDGHRAPRALLWIPLLWLGVPRELILHGLYLLFQFMLFGAVYSIMRTICGRDRLMYTAIAAFLFAVSVPQFLAFWWMFYQMELAVGLFLITLTLIYRRSLLAILTGGFGVLIHPATFMPFAIACAGFLAIQLAVSLARRRRPDPETLFMLGLLALALLAGRYLFGDFIKTYLDATATSYGWFYTKYPAHQQLQFTGLYIDFSLFRLANIYILPFAVIGLLMFVKRQLSEQKRSTYIHLSLLFIMAAILSFFAYYPFIYQNRFLILLDLVLIIFAVYPLICLIHYLCQEGKGRAMLALLAAGFVGYSSYFVLKQKPQLYPEELAEIRALRQYTEPGDLAMTTESIYTPWVYAFSKLATIDPGYLGVNKWNYEMWKEFWEGKSNDRRHELLRMYSVPLYIFVGKIVPDHIPYKRFIMSDPNFTQISPHVWRYDPRTVL